MKLLNDWVLVIGLILVIALSAAEISPQASIGSSQKTIKKQVMLTATIKSSLGSNVRAFVFPSVLTH